jgi:hypothetical protein
MIITYYERVAVVLVIQHEKYTCRIIFSYVACVVLSYFSTLFQMGRVLGKKKLLNIKCVF